MKKLYFIAFLLLITCTADAFRIPRPNRYSLPLTQDQINQINDDLDNIWQLSNGEFNLDEETTAKTQAENGDFWILATPITSKIQFKSEDTVFTICNEGGDCAGGGGGGSATPGGSNPQLQYNNAGTFGGVVASGADANGNVGLGTSVPTQQLELTENIEIVDSTATTGIIYSGSNELLHTYGSQSISLGEQAGNTAGTNPDNSVFIGYQSGNAITTGDNNVCLGSTSCDALNTGYENFSAGYAALGTATIATRNIAIGHQALTTCLDCGDNVAIGHNVMTGATDASDNVAVGASALAGNQTGTNNVAVGINALVGAVEDGNTAVGSNACAGIGITGFNNICLGNSAGDRITTSTENISIGTNSMGTSAGVTGSNNIAIGASSGAALTSGANNTCIGSGSCDSATSSYENSCVGYGSCASLDSSLNSGENTVMGFGAMGAATQGFDNVAIGYNALNTGTGTDNTAVGYEALRTNTGGDNNTAIGTFTMKANNDGTDNTAIGYAAMTGNTEGLNNTAVGVTALSRNTTGNLNTAVGSGTLDQITTGINNTCIGASSCRNANNGATNHNIGVGFLSDFGNGINRSAFIGNNVNVTKDHQLWVGTTGDDRLDAIFSGQVNAKGWSGVSNQNSGIDFSTFRNSWTSTQTTTDFFDISATALTTATGLVVKVDNSMTTGRALQVLGGASNNTPIFGVDDVITYLPQVSADPCGGDTLKEAGFFYNTTSDYLCFCNSAGADKQAHSPSTDCF